MGETEIIHLIEQYLQAKEKHKSKCQYNLNIIDELHANENAHTRILLKLLSYEQDGKKIALENFITIMNSNITKEEDKISFFKASKIFDQLYYIDGYIKSSDGWAIIIENKINWASDQESQIDRYIDIVISEGIPQDKIYVVYLTDNGLKKVWDGSLTIEGKSILGYIDENEPGRFIELNYRDDIMQLLNMMLQQLPPDRENIFVSAITQYNDYLEGRFGIRKSEKEYNDAMNKSLIEILNLSGTKTEKFEAIEKLQWELWNRLDTVKYEIYPNQQGNITRLLKDYFEKYPDIVAPFKKFRSNGDCVYCIAESIPLSYKKNKFFGIDINIGEENGFWLSIHIVYKDRTWEKNGNVFQNCFKKHQKFFEYLESNKKYRKGKYEFTTEGTFKDINDLQKKIVKLFSEIGECLS